MKKYQKKKIYLWFSGFAILVIAVSAFLLLRQRPVAAVVDSNLVVATPVPQTSATSSPEFKYVALLVEENLSYEDVIGNKDMPYFNYLAQNYGLATEYYANQHDSLVNYFWLTAGQPLNSDKNKTGFDVDNIFGRVMAAGLSWKAYEQSMPWPGFPWLRYGEYVRQHDPAAYFTNTMATSSRDSLVPGGELEHDILINKLPNFMLITPDAENDVHDGTMAQADQYLKNNIDQLINYPPFKQSGLLIITFDEGNLKPVRDDRHGGGRVATLVISSDSKPGYKSTTFYQQQNTLKEICDAFGFETCPGAADKAKDMAEFFK